MVKIITIDTGILFDSSTLPGAGVKFALKYFRPKNYPNINFISLFNDKIQGSSILGEDFTLTLDGAITGSYPVGLVNGVAVTSLDDLFTKFINSLY